MLRACRSRSTVSRARYAHAGGQYQWDSAVGVAVAGATGLHVSCLDGSPLPYNPPNGGYRV